MNVDKMTIVTNDDGYGYALSTGEVPGCYDIHRVNFHRAGEVILERIPAEVFAAFAKHVEEDK